MELVKNKTNGWVSSQELAQIFNQGLHYVRRKIATEYEKTQDSTLFLYQGKDWLVSEAGYQRLKFTGKDSVEANLKVLEMYNNSTKKEEIMEKKKAELTLVKSEDILTFDFEGTATINAIERNGEILLEANSVCKALGFANPRQAISSHVDEEDVHSVDTLTSGGKQKKNYVNESGMYALMLGSRKPEAKRFKKWVTSEVIPTIRKTGSYSMPGAPVKDENLSIINEDLDYLFDRDQVVATQIAQLSENMANTAIILNNLVKETQSKPASRAYVGKRHRHLSKVEPEEKYYTVQEFFSSFVGNSVDTHTSSRLSNKARRYCERNGLSIGQIGNKRFGKINTYPKNVLEHVLDGSGFGHSDADSF